METTRNLLILILLIVNILNTIDCCTVPFNDDKANIDTLVQVNVVWRHGARLPTVSYPKNPYADLNTWKNIGEDWGALSVVGRQMHYELGTYLRERYDGFITNKYSSDQFYIESSDTDRTIMSGLSNMAGLWPITEANPISQWNPKLNWQPIPIRVVRTSLDFMLVNIMNCKRTNELGWYYVINSTFAKAENEKYAPLYPKIAEVTGSEMKSFEDGFYIYDTVKAAESNGLPVPDFIKPFYADLEKMTTSYFSPKVFTPDLESKRLRCGHLLYLWLENMEARLGIGQPNQITKSKSKMQAYSGHDFTIAPCLGVFGVNDDFHPQPPFASALILELHKADTTIQDGDKNPRNYHVKLFYRNSTENPIMELVMPDCGYPCRLSTFKGVFRHIMQTEEEVKNGCNPIGKNEPNENIK